MPGAATTHSSDRVTQGVRVRVVPSYLRSESKPEVGEHLFAYAVTITNERDSPIRLMERRWSIADSEGVQRIVRGTGVVGQTPRLEPGQSFQYSSSVPIEAPWATMEGAYTFVDDHGLTFEAEVGRFYLVVPPEAG